MIGKDIACNIPPSPVVNLPRQHSLSAHMWLPRSCTATGGDSMSTAFLSLAQHKAKERHLLHRTKKGQNDIYYIAEESIAKSPLLLSWSVHP